MGDLGAAATGSLLDLDDSALRCYCTWAISDEPCRGSMNRCPWCKTPFRLAAQAAPRHIDVQWTDGYVPGITDKAPVLRCKACERCFLREDCHSDRLRLGEKVLEFDTLTLAEELHAAILQPPGWERDQEVRLRLLAWRADNDPLRLKYESPPPWAVLALGALASLGIYLFGYWLLLPGGLGRQVGPTMFQFGAELLATILTCLPLMALTLIAEYLGYRRCLRERERPDPNQRFSLNLQALYQLLRIEVPKERLLKAEAARQLGRFAEALALVAEHPAGESGPAVAATLEKIRQLAEKGSCLVHPLQDAARSKRLPPLIAELP